MRNLLTTLKAAIEQIPDGATIAVGGFNFQNKALASVREVIRQGKRDLILICGAPSSIDADLLVGAGCVREVIVQSISLERFGPVGPGFRRRSQAGEVSVVDADQGCVNAGMWAAKSGLDSYPSLAPLGADFEKVAPHWYKSGNDPFTSRPVVHVRAMRADYALLHAAISDIYGHGQQMGSVFNDRLIAGSAKNVILTADQIVPIEVIRRNPEKTFTWAHTSHSVIEAPFGAHPTACHGKYSYDSDHLREYAAMGRTEDGFEKYRETHIDVLDQPSYLETIGVRRLIDLDARRRQSQTEEN